MIDTRNDTFDVPIVLFLFKRKKTVLKIIDVLRKLGPKKIYLISDNGRTNLEREIVSSARNAIEKAIDWPCEIVKQYHDDNVGVYENIAQGARWVFAREKEAIFLEDDNLPDITFFSYCKELLNKYESEETIFWICGSNYLVESPPKDGCSYFFTQNMLPCGWASWSWKFLKYYDGELKNYSQLDKKKIMRRYNYKKLYYQDIYNIEHEIDYKRMHDKFYSWDYQMTFSLRYYNLYSVVPKYNLIKNIGVDNLSTHCGEGVMTDRFCENPIKSLEFPLIHPSNIMVDKALDKELSKLILDPSFFSFKSILNRLVRRCFKINKCVSIKNYINEKLRF